MVTVNQLIRCRRRVINKDINRRRFPQKSGVCVRVFIRTPKKPNSALRKLARVKLVDNNFVTAYIPGEGHNLIKFSTVLVRGGRVKDLPGVRHKLIRGKFDLAAVKGRRQSRSKYGAKMV